MALSSKDVLDQILEYHLVFDKYKNNEVEWKVKLPMFLDSFFPFVLHHSKYDNIVDIELPVIFND